MRLPLSEYGEGLKKGTRVGEGAFREVAAYILDHPMARTCSFCNEERDFSGDGEVIAQICSQECEDWVTADVCGEYWKLHAGNILVARDRNKGHIVLVPIDQGYCLPENFEDCTFDFPAIIDHIKSLDAEQAIELLKFHGWDLPPSCAHTLCISTMLLRKMVQDAEEAVLPGTSENAFLEAWQQS
ncbi:hypothetical protein SLEP1_g35019 [Rubroshorea leprosula]|uniref:1-phosphatidylinositol 4-kinase n=1 Tax=Rubroshorea leprosula TaxID=152421 RepID=A0AAV5KLX2_9ROSI|nr:hypothetical protein SLEP1_g35019 [Rubroshorea leprosula]